jgi:hypothetical protein
MTRSSLRLCPQAVVREQDTDRSQKPCCSTVAVFPPYALKNTARKMGAPFSAALLTSPNTKDGSIFSPVEILEKVKTTDLRCSQLRFPTLRAEKHGAEDGAPFSAALLTSPTAKNESIAGSFAQAIGKRETADLKPLVLCGRPQTKRFDRRSRRQMVGHRLASLGSCGRVVELDR